MSFRTLLSFSFYLSFCACFVSPPFTYAGEVETRKPRLLVLTDIGGDPDDIQSLRRLLLYANEFKIEGLVATATWGPKGQRKLGAYHIYEYLVQEAIDDYESILGNLKLHATDYPSADELRAMVYGGQKKRGVENLTVGSATPGSSHIIASVDASKDPLWISVWGGAHDLAQALLDVKSSRTIDETRRFVGKVRVVAIGDQDAKFATGGTGEWIREQFPGIFYVEAGPQWVRTKTESTAGYRGMYQNDSAGGSSSSLPLVKIGQELNQVEWVRKNITPYGELGEGYPADVNINPNTERNTRGVKEGDTPAWFFVLPHGLNNPEHPEWGGWGGRYEPVLGNQYADAQDDHWSGARDGGLRRKWTVARWRGAYQNDFAARMRWCALSFDEANHNPVAIIDDDRSRDVLKRTVTAGETLTLDGSDSFDPDGDRLTYKWWIYHEASSSSAIINDSQEPVAKVQTAKSSPVGDVHVILQLDDSGDPQLTTYRRVIVRVRNESSLSKDFTKYERKYPWSVSKELIERKVSFAVGTTNFDESRVPTFRLPDILTASSGRKVTTTEVWERQRRGELQDMFSSEVFGRAPPKPETLTFERLKTDALALNGNATYKRIAIRFKLQDQTFQFHLDLFHPNEQKGGVPVFLLLNHRGPSEADSTREKKSEFWPVEYAISRGYAFAVVHVADEVEPDKPDMENGVRRFYEKYFERPSMLSWGTLSAWAWAGSRAVDYLETDSCIDSNQIAIVGHSRGGKTVLWAAAQDMRISLVIPNNAGDGGSAIARRRFGNTIEVMTGRNPHWFVPKYASYAGKEETMPFDQHMLVALIAPRKYYSSDAANDLWHDPWGSWIGLREASEVWSLYGFPSVGNDDFPLVNDQLMKGPIGYHIREGGHGLRLYDWKLFMDYADQHFK